MPSPPSDIPEQLKRLLEASPLLKCTLEILQTEVSRLVHDEVKAADILTELLHLRNVRPAGWKPTSNATYYKKKYGDLLMTWLKQLEANPDKNLVIETKKVNRSRETIKTIIGQAWDWLIENEKDNDKRNALIEQRGSLCLRKVALGIMIMRKHNHEEQENFIASLVKDVGNSPLEEVKKWKQDVIQFTENAEDGQKLVLNSIALEPYDIEWLQQYIKASCCLFPTKILSSSIEIIKHSELWKKMNPSSSDE